ncbi:olfactory receptor 1038-like [Trichosurus vulpecula]|uniref:olfactory receptor 1038-like n=1 Tax=Trichosurus vulpecula TaxID=9337 RepID=UPI00186AF1DC|nr:olfactory receptor 1038-like [Trichosurus vulpecula]
MANSNHSQVTEFILLGLTTRPELQVVLFIIFLIVYSISVVRNLGLILLIQVSSQLHTPMYFFLSHLAFVDFSFTSAITPNMLINFVQETNVISFHACAIQVYCFISFVNIEMFLLAVMAYDRYVAIGNPLLYTVAMSHRLCVQLVAVPYVYCFSMALFHTIITFQFSYCASNVINHFYCDYIPLLALSCSDTHVKEILIFAFARFDIISSLLIVIISYIFIIAAILRIRSTEGRLKAFSTCGSHMVAVTIFYGTLIFMYLQPQSNHSLDTDKMTSVFYTTVIPMLNPLIYSLRNKDVKAALRKGLGNSLILVHLRNFCK